MIPTVNVTATIYDQSGNAVPGAIVTAKLTIVDSYLGYVIPLKNSAIADSSGQVTFALWPNVLGASGSQYSFSAIDPETGNVLFSGKATVPNANTNLYTILPTTAPPTLDAATVAMNAAAADKLAADADVVLTNADAVSTAADVVSTAANATTASNSATSATSSATSAATSATSATASQTASSASETNAATSSANALNSSSTASTSATNAANSEANAAASSSSAATSSTNASTSAAASATSATNAATAEGNSSTSATASAASAASAATDAATAMNRYSFQGVYNAATTYAKNDVVTSAVTSKGDYGFVSLQAANLNHTPPVSGVADAWWGIYVAGGADGVGVGDMLAATYDPTVKAADAFSMNNMVEGAATKILTGTERTDIANNKIHAASAHAPSGATVNSTDAALRDTDTHTDGAVNGIYTLTERTKLAGVAAGADVAPITSIHGRTGVVVSANGDYTATEITNAPAGGVAAVTVQAAIAELDVEKEPGLGNPAADGDVLASTIAGVRSWATPSGGGSGGVNNILINGAFDIWQDGTSFPAIVTRYFADMWEFSKSSAASFTLARSTDVPTPAQAGKVLTYSTSCVVNTAAPTTAASDYAEILTLVEGYNYRELHGGQFTVSFWCKSSVPGVYSVTLVNADFSRDYIAETTVNTANTWEEKTLTFTADTAGVWLFDNGVGLRIYIQLVKGSNYISTPDVWATGIRLTTSNQVNFAATSGNTFLLADVRLVKGTSAANVNTRSYGDELALCQRYFTDFSNRPQHSMISGIYSPSSGYTFWLSRSLPVEMRVNPTVTLAGFTPTAAGAVALQAASKTGFSLMAVSNIGGFNWFSNDANNTLKFNARL